MKPLLRVCLAVGLWLGLALFGPGVAAPANDGRTVIIIRHAEDGEAQSISAEGARGGNEFCWVFLFMGICR